MNISPTLPQRCTEVIQWKKTGLYSGTALRELADSYTDHRRGDLRAAEIDTATEAMDAIATMYSRIFGAMKP